MHFAHPQQERADEKRDHTKRNRDEQGAYLCDKAQLRPRVEPLVICRPADQRQQCTGDANLPQAD